MANRFSIAAVFEAVDRITRPVARMQTRIGRFTNSATKGMKRLDKSVNRVVKSLGRGLRTAAKFGGAVLLGLGGAVGFVVSQFSKMEDAQAAFTPIIGSAKKAKELVDSLNETAATTPFQFDTLADSAKQLLPVIKGGSEEVIKTMRMLGDTAGGNAQKMQTITRGFTKAMLKGKVDLESLNMIAEAGVPIFTELADSMGVSTKQLFKMVTAGEVTTDQLTKSFRKMTSEGGVFFKGMEIASQTTSGKLSTMRDNINLAAAQIGEALSPAVKELIDDLTGVAKRLGAWAKENKKLIGDSFKKFVNMIRDNLPNIIKWAKIIGKIIVVLGTLIITLKSVAAIMTVVNLIMTANPIGLVVVAIGLLVAAITTLITHWDSFVTMWKESPRWFKLLAIVMTGFVTGPIALLIGAVSLIKEHWGSLAVFFDAFTVGVGQQWEKLGDNIGVVVDWIGEQVDWVVGKLSMLDDATGGVIGSIVDMNAAVYSAIGGAAVDAFDFATGHSGPEAPQPQVVPSAGADVSRSEVTIKDESGRAEVTKKPTNSGRGALRLLQTGAD